MRKNKFVYTVSALLMVCIISFTNIGSTILDNFDLGKCQYGEGFNKFFK